MAGPALIDDCPQFDTRAAGRGTDPPQLAPESSRTKSRPKSLPTTQPALITPAASRQRGQLPDFAPLLEEFEVAGWSSHRRELSGNFHDWLLVEGRELLVMVGQAVSSGTVDVIETSLVAQAAWTAVRAHALHVADAGALLSLAARSLWPMTSAKVYASVAVARIDTAEGLASVAIAGDCLAWKVRAAAAERIAANQPLLGEVPDFTYPSYSVQLSLRERLLLVADNSVRRPAKLVTTIASSFAQLDAECHRRMMANDAVAMLREHYACDNREEPLAPVSMIAVRRR